MLFSHLFSKHSSERTTSRCAKVPFLKLVIHSGNYKHGSPLKMATSPKSKAHSNLQKVAAQIATIKILPVAMDEKVIVRATATFATRSFTMGEYQVGIGIQQALLHLDHPSFDRSSAYQATLPKDTWSENSTEQSKSEASGHFAGGLKAKFGGLFHLGAQGALGKERQEAAEQKSTLNFQIVSATPSGWRIGTERGDPRSPRGTLPIGLEHC